MRLPAIDERSVRVSSEGSSESLRITEETPDTV